MQRAISSLTTKSLVPFKERNRELIPFRSIRWIAQHEDKLWHPRIYRITCVGNCNGSAPCNSTTCGTSITRAGTGTSDPNPNRKEYYGKVIMLDPSVNIRGESKPQYMTIETKPVVQKIKCPIKEIKKDTDFLKAHHNILTTIVDPELRKIEIIETVEE